MEADEFANVLKLRCICVCVCMCEKYLSSWCVSCTYFSKTSFISCHPDSFRASPFHSCKRHHKHGEGTSLSCRFLARQRASAQARTSEVSFINQRTHLRLWKVTPSAINWTERDWSQCGEMFISEMKALGNLGAVHSPHGREVQRVARQRHQHPQCTTSTCSKYDHWHVDNNAKIVRLQMNLYSSQRASSSLHSPFGSSLLLLVAPVAC